MLKYEPGDIATFYFIINEYNDTKEIKGWTSKKQLAEFYIDFHKCPKYQLKKITKPIEEIYKITEDYYHSEIIIGNILVKNREKKGEVKLISIPATQDELNFIHEESSTFFATMMGYSYLNNVIPYLKKKYIEALDDIFLSSVIKKAIHNQSDKINQYIQLDELMILLKSFPENFGE